MGVASPMASVQFTLTALSYAALTYAFVVSDFSVKLVVDNSHTLKPLMYKLSGVWGNHEGSMLLWVLILTLFGASAAWFGGNLPRSLQARVLCRAIFGHGGVHGFHHFHVQPVHTAGATRRLTAPT